MSARRFGRSASFAEIAEREAQGERHIRLLAPLAFLSPCIIAAIVAPADLTVTGLAKAVPYSGPSKRRGLDSHCPNAGVIGHGDTIAEVNTRSKKREPPSAMPTSYPKALREPSLSTIEPVSAAPKWKLENGAQRPAPETRPARIWTRGCTSGRLHEYRMSGRSLSRLLLEP